MSSILSKALSSGIRKDQSAYEKRGIRITNAISLILIGFSLFLSLILYIFYNQIILSALIILASVVFSFSLFLNRWGLINISRWFISFIVPVFSLIISITSKTNYAVNVQPSNFFDVRFILVASLAVPIIIIPLKDLKLFVAGVLPSFLSLCFFDPLHDALNLGYFQLGQISSDYYFAANFYPLLSYLFVLGCFVFLKRVNEDYEQTNDDLIHSLHSSNEELKQKNIEIELQNNEIQAQSEELITSQDQLMEAYGVIEKQKVLLEGRNEILESTLITRNEELSKANEELIKHNNELLQFSYTVSHNLRGPVARILGLTHLLTVNNNPVSEEQSTLVKLIRKSSQELDDIIRDLNKIVDIRNELYNIKEKVYFQDEWNVVYSTLSSQLSSEMDIRTDFTKAPYVFTIRPILNSVLYNLFSNALKYRSPQRPLRVFISTAMEGDLVKLAIVDNGLGMNLDQFGDKVFGIYRRFHTHTEGKGLGLYLVKSQMEVIGGSIELKSDLNVGTSFTLSFKTPKDIEGQICFQSDYGVVYYNARINTAGIRWLCEVNSEQYRQLFNKSIEVVRLYHTPYWITDMRNQGIISVEDQKWMISTIFPEASRNGLRKIAGIYSPDQFNDEYRSRIRQTAMELGVTLQFFTSHKQAENWIEEQYVNEQMK